MLARTCQAYRSIVDKAEMIGRSHPEESLHLALLCGRCGVTERTLRAAFKAICGTTPYRHLRTLRMRAAHRALLNARDGTTVTLVAMQFGFLELGRFSVEYRAAFGERPSDTLRRASLSVTPRRDYPAEVAPSAFRPA